MPLKIPKPDAARLAKFQEIDRSLGRYAEKLSRFLWPWRELWLLLVVVILVSLDFFTTWALLDLSGKNNVYESGPLAFWALQKGGFPFLLLIDLIAAGVLSTAALVSRYLYSSHNYAGYGRAAFVFILTPYIIYTVYAVINNVVLQFR
jgi:hypothetical protein